MELIEMLGWVVLGFVSTLGGLEFMARKLADRGKMILRTDLRVGGGELIGI
jgi:hypothetical protein